MRQLHKDQESVPSGTRVWFAWDGKSPCVRMLHCCLPVCSAYSSLYTGGLKGQVCSLAYELAATWR